MSFGSSVVVCGLPEAGRLHVQHREGEAATLHDVYAIGSLLCALPAQPDAELAAQLPQLVRLHPSATVRARRSHSGCVLVCAALFCSYV